MVKNDKTIFENQNNFRVLNQIKIMDYLKKGPQSCAALSEAFSLSFTAVSKILTELCQSGLTIMLPAHPEPGKKAGRWPNYFALNDRLGVVGALDFSSHEVRIALARLDNTIVLEKEIPESEIISKTTLDRVGATLEELLASPEINGLPLLGICISSPGVLTPDGHYVFAHRIQDYEHLNMKRYFAERFGVEVDVYHDVKLGCVGERVFGSIPKEAQNLYFAYIDNEAGSSFFLNGHLYDGSHGFAGEVNDLAPVDPESKSSMNGNFFTLSDIREALNKALMEAPDHPLKKKNRYTTSDVVALFEAGDPLVTSILDRSARYNAIELLAVANFLDVDYLVLQGRILTFGERYHALLNHYFALYDLNHNQAKIVFSTLGSRANLLGAVYQGGNIYWLKRFGEMTAKRTTSDDYDVTAYFGDNI